MDTEPATELAKRIVLTLFPLRDGSGLESCICEQILTDALAAVPRPTTVGDLRQVLERHCLDRGIVGIELIEQLRAREDLPDELPLERLVG